MLNANLDSEALWALHIACKHFDRVIYETVFIAEHIIKCVVEFRVDCPHSVLVAQLCLTLQPHGL